MKNIKDLASALTNFTETLEVLTEALSNNVDSENGGVNMVDLINKSTNTIEVLTETLKIVSENVVNINSKTDEILSLIKDLKSEKENGIFTKTLNDTKVGKSISDGVSTILLMSGGLMALGLAMNVVADVDPTTIIAISTSMALMSYSFSKIAENKDLTIGQVLMVSAIMVGMASAVVLSSMILRYTQPLPIWALIGAVETSIIMAIVSFGVTGFIKGIKDASIKDILMLPLVMPLIAGGIVASSWILAYTQPLGLSQLIGAVETALVMAVASIPMFLLIKTLKGTSLKDIAYTVIAMPLIASGLVATSYVLGYFTQEALNYENILKGTALISVVSILMTLPILFITKTGLSIGNIIQGTASMVILSAGITAISYVLGLGDYTNAPSMEWMTSVMVGMLIATPTVIALGLVGIPISAMGVASMLILSAGISAMSYVLGLGDYTKAPSLEWATTLGLLFLALVPTAIILGNPIMLGVSAMGVASMLILAGGLVKIADIVRGGTYTNAPSKEWAEGVGLSLVLFGNALTNISPNVFSRILGDETTDTRIDSLIRLASSLKLIGDAVRGGTYTNAPPKEWAEGVGLSLSYFANALSTISPDLIDRLFGESTQGRIDSLITLAGSLGAIAQKLNENAGVYTNYPSKEWAEGVGTTLLSFSQSIQALSDNLDSDEIVDWIPSIISLAEMIGKVSLVISNNNYDSYPKSEWINSIMDMGKIFIYLNENSDDIEDGLKVFSKLASASTQIDMLATSYDNLATSIGKVIQVTKSFKGDNLDTVQTLASSFMALGLVDRNAMIGTINDFFKVVSTQTDTINESKTSVFDNIKDRLSQFASSNVTTSNTPQVKSPTDNNKIKSQSEIMELYKKQVELLEQLVKNTKPMDKPKIDTTSSQSPIASIR